VPMQGSDESDCERDSRSRRAIDEKRCLRLRCRVGLRTLSTHHQGHHCGPRSIVADREFLRLTSFASRDASLKCKAASSNCPLLGWTDFRRPGFRISMNGRTCVAVTQGFLHGCTKFMDNEHDP
jgi:hypothetical protein